MKLRNMGIFTLLIGFGQSLHAIPDPTKGNPLSQHNVEIPSGISTIFQDSENRNNVYVGPRDKQSFIGQYVELGSQGPQCDELINIQKQAYRFFDTDVELDEAYRKGQFVSNYYQISYALPRANIEDLQEIILKRQELTSLENLPDYVEYEKMKTIYLAIESTITSLKSSKNDALANFTTNVAQCTLAPDQKDCIKEATIRLNETILKIDTELLTLSEKKNEMLPAYASAKAPVDALEDKLKLLESERDFLLSIYSAQNNVVSAAWTIEREVLESASGEVTGKATVPYNVFNGEVADVMSALSKAGIRGYNVTQLPIFNVQLNSGIRETNLKVQLDEQTPIYTAISYKLPASTMVNMSFKDYYASPFSILDPNTGKYEMAEFYVSTPDSIARSGGFEMIITKSARCGGYTKIVEQNISFETDSGIKKSFIVNRNLHEPAVDRGVLSTSVGMTYNYYIQPGPMDGNCWMDVAKANNYWRSSGKKTSRSFFKKSSHSWDDTKLTVSEDMGLNCNLTIRPQGSNPEESLLMAEAFERSMYDDMYQMWVAMYAKEYEVKKLEPSEVAVSNALSNLAAGVRPLCGSNTYCQVGSLVLKSIDELAGTYHTGSTSAVVNYSGGIQKRFSKNTYTLSQGSTSIEMRACVDRTTCNL